MHHAPAREQSIKTSKAKHYLKPDYSFEQFKDDCVVAFYGDIHFTYSGNDHRIQLPGFEEIVVVDDDDEFVPVHKSTTRDWDEFWSMPIFGYSNWEELYQYIESYEV